MYNLIAQIKQVARGRANLPAAISDFERELIPRGAEQVKCSIENGIMLHDWEKEKAEAARKATGTAVSAS